MRRLRKKREDPIVRLALAITTPEQARRGDLRLVDVSNHSDADQRHMVRSGERKTIRRLTHIEKLKNRGVLDDREAAACQWYADAHAARYDTLGIAAKYGDGGGGGSMNFDHLPKTREQEDAWLLLDYARSCISPPIRGMFDRIVVHQWRVGKLGILLKLASRQLMHGIEDRVDLDSVKL